MLALGLIVGVILAMAVFMVVLDFTESWDPLDYNHDGKVTATDLVQVHRLELQIKAKLLGKPDPFGPTIVVSGTWTEPSVTWAGPKEAE